MGGMVKIADDRAFRSLARSLYKNAIQSEMEVHKYVSDLAHRMRLELRRVAPRQSGKYSHGWRVQDNNKTIASFSIYNQVSYGVHIEAGVNPGDDPWPVAGPNTVKRTVNSQSKIWSRKAVGGTVEPYLRKLNPFQITRDVMHIMMEGIIRA